MSEHVCDSDSCFDTHEAGLLLGRPARGAVSLGMADRRGFRRKLACDSFACLVPRRHEWRRVP
jgi:hypothetical protein